MIMKYFKWIAGIVAGASVGFAYWYFIGCTTSGCAITSSPVNSALYGSLMGALLVSSFTGKPKPDKNKMHQ